MYNQNSKLKLTNRIIISKHRGRHTAAEQRSYNIYTYILMYMYYVVCMRIWDMTYIMLYKMNISYAFICMYNNATLSKQSLRIKTDDIFNKKNSLAFVRSKIS